MRCFSGLQPFFSFLFEAVFWSFIIFIIFYFFFLVIININNNFITEMTIRNNTTNGKTLCTNSFTEFSFTLTPEEGYGEVDPSRIIDLPIEIFVDREGNKLEDLLKAGAIVPLVNGMGQVVPGKVVEVAEKTVKMDLNSPMAGKTLNFSGEILTVREATQQELQDGLHGEFVHSNCNGGCNHHNCNGHCNHDSCDHTDCNHDSCQCNCE